MASPGVAVAARDAPSGVALRFLYVEGNVGGATAGHTAVRLDDAVFHFQHDGDIFRLMREGWERFRLEYGGFQNRPIHAAGWTIAKADAEALRQHLTQLHLEAFHALGRREAARGDRALLDDWLEDRPGTRVPGAGWFVPEATAARQDDGLRQEVRAALDLDALRRRSAAALERAFADVATSGPEAGHPRAVQRLGQQIAQARALQLLDESRPLVDDALVPAGDWALSPQERHSLEALARELGQRVTTLVRGEDPRQAKALLIAMARHRATRSSLASDRLWLLDRSGTAGPAGPAGPTGSDADRQGVGRGSLPEEREASRALAARLLARERGRILTGGSPGELAWNRLEELATRGARRPGAAPVVRVAPPARPGVAPVSWPDAGSGLTAAHGRASRRARALEEEIQLRFAYDLLARNCVTELVVAVQTGLGGAERAEALLGGPLSTAGPLGSAPAFFHGAVESLPGVRRTRTASYREEALARESQRAGWLSTRLRESNVLTSSLYQRRDADGSFLLFTSDAKGPERLMMPLLALANLSVGVGETLVGAVTAPFDAGHRLRRGLRGTLFSLPELGFVNVRKGSFDARSLDAERYPAPLSSGP